MVARKRYKAVESAIRNLPGRNVVYMNDSCLWMVQSTVRGETLERLERACAESGKPFQRIPIVPFSEEMPADLPDVDGPFVFYGYTTLMLAAANHARWCRGIFFNPLKFCPRAYHAAWGADFLNHDGRIVTFADLAAEGRNPDERLFLRPNDDLKRFTGGVMTYQAFLDWYAGFAGATDTAVRDDTEVLAATVKDIGDEWRLFYVGGVRVTESLYQPNAQRGMPVDVGIWADERARRWYPSDAFVMDVARLADDSLAIIECNCINGSGLYEADTTAFVRAISTFQESVW